MAIEEILYSYTPEGSAPEGDTQELDQGWFYDEPTPSQAPQSAFPSFRLHDSGESLTLSADVPGLAQDDISVRVSRDLIHISGKRKERIPHGFELVQRERPELEFERKIKLYTRVDPARGAAHLEAGVLTITLRKAAESGAQRIPIRKV
ncbi:MAG: Hsp20/alpha crystallin family protein [Polyangiaceae bacterium]|nr:Hsp20/alpha crystallin family protein [Myxococcales bacterium]MCB9584514.1 Hsp20/alpha crystallin family protein [Polyangiaceae bacterium]MCB9609358.1 Hsp20/alpha crystallin family protein [Polyangiaceae bacterium]